jgi:hypothetical protein
MRKRAAQTAMGGIQRILPIRGQGRPLAGTVGRTALRPKPRDITTTRGATSRLEQVWDSCLV